MRAVLAFAAVCLAAGCSGRGAPCNAGMLGECGFGLYCKTPELSNEGTCACIRLEPSLDAGDDCIVDTCDVCRDGLVCMRATGACAPPRSQPAGAACTTSDDCVPGLVCGVGTCEPPGSRDEGDPCTTNDNCIAGLRCDLPLDPGHCRAPIEGELCHDADDCVPGMTCNGGYAPAECHPPQPSGGYCAAPDDCATTTCLPGPRVCS
ncbi:MAG: hypothetical protein KIT31_12610 [Deltaproteobacteria bacterium]|nr:hypothetical protein [Deltaproteobacteria bacterium]